MRELVLSQLFKHTKMDRNATLFIQKDGFYFNLLSLELVVASKLCPIELSLF